MAEQDAQFFQVLIRQMRKDANIYPVVGKALGIPFQSKFPSQLAICCTAVTSLNHRRKRTRY